MTIYARVSDPATIVNILSQTWEANVGSADNPFALLFEGAFTAQYDYRGMDVQLHFDRVDGSATLEAGWTGEWNHDPDFGLVGPDFHADTIPNEGGSELPQVVAGPFVEGQFKPGDPKPDGSGLIYMGDANIGGEMRYSDDWQRPFDILRGGL